MKKRALIVFFALLVMLVAMVSPTVADDSSCTTDPNDGSGLPECGSPTDNACYAGGVMEGKCVGEWEWKAGWHLARFLAGTMTREQVPQDFQIVLPPPAEPGSEPLRLCISEMDSHDFYVWACITSDQTGWLTVTHYDESETISLLFVDGDSAAACPQSYNQQIVVTALPTAMLLMVLVDEGIFTAEQVDALRLKPVMCVYADPGRFDSGLNTDAAIQFARSN